MKYGFILLMVVILAGCAVSPQQVAITPTSVQSMPPASPGRDVLNLSVVDNRSTPILGTLGGTYSDTATLSASNDIRADLERILIDRLSAADYQINSSSQAIAFRVSLDQLEYERVTGTVGSEVQVRAIINLQVDDGRRFIERTYRSSTIQTRVTRPTADDNRLFLEEVLNSSLDRLIQDASVHEFLARP
jgi:uncharacterized lipoprotein